MFFRLTRLSVLPSLSELKEKLGDLISSSTYFSRVVFVHVDGNHQPEISRALTVLVSF